MRIGYKESTMERVVRRLKRRVFTLFSILIEHSPFNSIGFEMLAILEFLQLLSYALAIHYDFFNSLQVPKGLYISTFPFKVLPQPIIHSQLFHEWLDGPSLLPALLIVMALISSLFLFLLVLLSKVASSSKSFSPSNALVLSSKILALLLMGSLKFFFFPCLLLFLRLYSCDPVTAPKLRTSLSLNPSQSSRSLPPPWPAGVGPT